MVRREALRSPANAIELENISKTFRLPHERRDTLKEHLLHPFRRIEVEHQVALDDVSLDVLRGEFFGIVGPNGSGKSTLLKIIAGIYRQDAGRVRVGGVLSPFIELGVGFNPELTGRDNIRVNATLLGMGRKQLSERFDQIVAFAETERFLDQKLKNYSSGMQVRLAYAIAIQAEFDILLLDEVLAVGDERFQQKCMATFSRFREEGKTIVLVSHGLSTIVEFCDRAALIDRGALVIAGDPAEVVDIYRGGVAAEGLSRAG